MIQTRPAPPSPADVARRTWRRLRTMRTAIVLLLILGAAASVGSFFPQRPVSVAAVNEWIAGHPGWAPVAEFLGLFDVYGAWWFMGIYALLLVSLVGCLVPRYRGFWRALRAEPYLSASLDAQSHHLVRETDQGPEEVLARAHATLRRRRFRVARRGGLMAAERGSAREGGSLLFHTSFLVLLLGVSIGKLWGFTGQVAVIEGERFADTPIEYDFLETGRSFGNRFSGVELALDEFDVSWYPNGVPREFRSSVRLFDDGEQVRQEDVVVNSPLTYGSLRVYQLSWGWAPVLRVAQGGRVLYDGPTIFLSEAGVWRGVVKVPQTEPQDTGFEMLFFTDPVVETGAMPRNGRPEPVAPVVLFQQYLGDLRLDRAQSVFRLDPRHLSPAEVGALRLGDTASLPNGVEITFSDLKQYSVFQIASNPGALLLLIAAGLLLVGLVPALYSARRRVWVRATAADGVTRVEIAGHAIQRKAAFEAEFAALAGEVVPEPTIRTGVPSG